MSTNRECPDQTARMWILICTFAVHIWCKGLSPMLHKLCFWGEIRNIITRYDLFSGPMRLILTSHNVRKCTFEHASSWRFKSAWTFTVWSESSLHTVWKAKDAKFLHADNKDWSDWTDMQTDLSLLWAHIRYIFWCCSFYSPLTHCKWNELPNTTLYCNIVILILGLSGYAI